MADAQLAALEGTPLQDALLAQVGKVVGFPGTNSYHAWLQTMWFRKERKSMSIFLLFPPAFAGRAR